MRVQRHQTVLSLPTALDVDTSLLSLTAERVARRRRNARWLIVAGLLVFVGGFAGFGVVGDRSDQLAATGVHTRATVVDAAVYSSNGGRIGRNAFSEHVDVRFTTGSGRVVTARCWIGEDNQFRVGQQIAVVYDPAHPTRAQLAHDPDLGPIGFPLLLAIVVGLVVAVVGVLRARSMTRAIRGLRSPPGAGLVTVEMGHAGRRRALVARIEAADGRVAQVRSTVIGGSGIIPGRPMQGLVFGVLQRRRSVVVMQTGGAIVTGRVTYVSG